MRARVLFFGLLKDVVDHPSEEIELPDGSDLRAVFDCYAARYPRLRELARSIVVAKNHEFADLGARLADGDEVAFLPPVSGGALPDPNEISEAGNYFAITRHAIDSRAILAKMLTGAEGAVVTFDGTVRNNTNGRATRFLDYECYAPMALKVMARIGLELAASPDITRVAMVHRVGRMLIGETSVVVIVTAPHRRPAFEAALEGINRLKKLVPVWKKEYFEDGEVWVEGEWHENVSVAG